MEYTRHYTKLIERAKNRELLGFSEKHHIIPKCMGGGDNPENLVDLTAEEHYVAHQLLIKIYPNESGLIYATLMMTCGRNTNKLYGWLRRKHSQSMKLKTGEKNSQYGTCWISNLETSECKKINKNLLELHLEAGWIKKRIIKWDEYFKICPKCIKSFVPIKEEKYCSKECRKKSHNISSKNLGNTSGKNNNMWRGYWYTPYGIFETLQEASDVNKDGLSTSNKKDNGYSRK
jgi:hypothetical protein